MKKIQSKYLIQLLLLVLLICSCSSSSKVYKIGVDPTFYPLSLGGKEVNVFAFFNELCALIAKKNRISIERVNRSWDNVLDGLQKEEYNGALSSIIPRVFNQSRYHFSDILLQTGPIIITTKESSIHSIKDLDDKIVAVAKYSKAEIELAQNATISLRTYNQIPDALNQLVAGHYQAVMVDIVPAVSYVNDLYAKELKIVNAPLFDEGIRLISMKSQSDTLIHMFNETLEQLKKSGEYQKLLGKWKVGI